MFLSVLDQLDVPNFRQDQIRKAWFAPYINAWSDVSTLPKEMRRELSEKYFWTSVELKKMQRSDTAIKALMKLSDGQMIETVLMKNARGSWTACVSSQVGCAMACDFCATGKMGFMRDLSLDEIVDQMRFWQQCLCAEDIDGELSNVVMMGMGEPLNNYDNVRDAMKCFIEDMGIGKTKITLSTVGVKQGMEKLMSDPDWPDVRLAISLHFADQTKRMEHMPVARQRDLDELKDCCKRYLKKYGNRNHHITFEYLMLEGVNDSDEDIKSLVAFLKGLDRYKINLIPWNEVGDLQYNRLSQERTEAFQEKLRSRGIKSTIRKSLGREIDAGCGQLYSRMGKT